MTWQEKCKDPRWQKKRLEILERDNWTCVWCCAKDKTLHVHHCYYESGRDPWDYPSRSLLTLCECCHKAEREHGEQELEEALEVLKRDGFTVKGIAMALECLPVVRGDAKNVFSMAQLLTYLRVNTEKILGNIFSIVDRRKAARQGVKDGKTA